MIELFSDPCAIDFLLELCQTSFDFPLALPHVKCVCLLHKGSAFYRRIEEKGRSGRPRKRAEEQQSQSRGFVEPSGSVFAVVSQSTGKGREAKGRFWRLPGA